MSSVFSDLRSAARSLLRRRRVVLPAVLCLALGVGTSAAMTSFLDALLFRPPAHVEAPGSIQRVYFTDTFPGFGEFTSSVTSYPVFRDLGAVRSYSRLGAFFTTEVSLGRGAQARRARAVLVTPGFLPMLGVKPRLGRLFLESEGEPGQAGAVAILSHDLWRSAFAASPEVVDRRLVVGKEVYTVVGVLPRGFTGLDLQAVDLWLPMTAATGVMGSNWADSRGSQFLEIAGRLQNRISPAAAAAETTAVFRAASATAGRPKPAVRVSLAPIQRARGPDAPPAVGVAAWLAGLSWIVLLISCGNVASLLMVRGLDRCSELALRLALGSRVGRVARLMLLDSALIAGLGAVAAWLVFVVLAGVLERFVLPDAAVRVGQVGLRSLLLVVGLSALAGLLSGLAPALWASRRRLLGAAHSGGRHATPGRSLLHAGLAAAQLALTFALLAAALVFVRSLDNVLALDLGLDAKQLIVVNVDLQAEGYPAARVDQFFQAAAERVKQLPGVEKVSLAATIPFATSNAVSVAVPGLEQLPQLSTGGPYINAVTADFFAASGTRILRGRDFSAQDRAGAASVVMLNETMARLLWPGEPATQRCLKIGGEQAPCATVVGVVEDARRSSLMEDETMQLYVPLEQAPEELSSRVLFARVASRPEAKTGSIRREVQALSPNLPYIQVQPLSDLLEPQLRRWRVGASVLTSLGLLSLGLAVLGLYGVIAHAMARRSFELGVRFALGAQRRHVFWLALRQGFLIALAGCAGGLLIALTGARFLQPLLFQVSASDPLILAGAAAIVIVIASIASYAPSRRAANLDPAAVLRAD